MSSKRDECVQVFADYHQFYVWDSGVNPQAPEDWSDEDVSSRAKVANHVLVVCPIRAMTVPVRIALHQSQPELNHAGCDHVVAASLSLPTGQLQVHECTGGEVLAWNVPAGTYEALILYRGLRSISSDGLEGDDSYEVHLWLGSPRPLEVLKQWLEEA